MPLEGDPSWMDTSVLFMGMASLYVYWSLIQDFVVANAQALLVSGLLIMIIALMDRVTNAHTKLRNAVTQRDLFVDVLRRVHPLTNGESNMSEDIKKRISEGRLLDFNEVRRISSRLLKTALDDLVRSKKLKPDDRDIVAEHIAVMCGNWELYPKRTVVLPESSKVKEEIKARILRVDPSKIDPVPIPGAKVDPPPRGLDRLRRKVA